MKAVEVIEQYKNGRRDFRGESLRGCDFKNQDLSGADFSGCDIRGANFSRANLTEVKLEKAKAGLRKRWMIILLLVALVLMVISSFVYAIVGVFVAYIFDPSSTENQIAGWVSLIFLLLFSILTWRKNILAGAVAGAVAAVVVGAEVVVGAVVAGAVVVVGGAKSGAFALFFTWIGWLTLKQEHRDPWLRRIVLAFAGLGGTSFFQANLTATDFTGATLKSTNFNQAKLNKTIFKQVIKLYSKRLKT